MISRRLLLQGVLTVLSGRRTAVASDSARSPTPSLRLSAAELKTVVAYGEVLVDGRALSPGERDDLAEHVEDSARRSPDTLVLFRTTAELLDRLAGARFVDLDLEERRALVTRHRLDARPVGGEQDSRSGEETLVVRTRVIPDLIEGYWSSPAGWAAVGYTTFPGRCGDLTRYTRPEA